MHKALFTVTAAALVTLAAFEVFAAPAKVVLKRFNYVAPVNAIHVAIPGGTKFSTDLLPQ
jgi:hypothetical protein